MVGPVQKLLDFDLVIEPRGDGYRTRVVASPAGEAQADFALPFSDEGLENLVLKVVGSIGRARRKVRRIEPQESRLIEDFGSQLFALDRGSAMLTPHMSSPAFSPQRL